MDRPDLSRRTLRVREETAGGHGRILRVVLAAEPQLNAADPEMLDGLLAVLDALDADPGLVCLVLEGSGTRAFCAGGDIKRAHALLAAEGMRRGGAMERFFAAEYRADYLMHLVRQPVVAWLGGITMGGGLGLANGASHRVVTETSRLAMPEITIGLYPDVGASWFYNRCPGRTGLFLGLTGATVGASDALFCGLADVALPESARGHVLDGLAGLPWTGDTAANRILVSRYLRASAMAPPAGPVRQHFDFIQELTEHDVVLEFAAALDRAPLPDPWFERAAATFRAGCPLSAHVTWRLHRERSRLGLRATFQRDLGISWRMAEHPDWMEGIRALLVDKDRRPRWSPPTLAEVSPNLLARVFTSPWSAADHPFHDLPPEPDPAVPRVVPAEPTTN